MDSRGVYKAKNEAEAKRYAGGINKFVGQVDDLMKEWAALVGPDVVKGEAAQKFIALVNDFAKFRRETAKLGIEEGPEAATKQGNNDANRANRPALTEARSEERRVGKEWVSTWRTRWAP